MGKINEKFEIGNSGEKFKDTIRVKNVTMSSLDEFKTYVKTNAPVGISIYNLNTGAQQCAIVHKMSANYCGFILFGYAANLVQYRCYNGTWT